MPKQLPNKEFLSIQEASKFLRVSTKTLRRWEESGAVKSLRTSGGHRRYSEVYLQKIKDGKKPRIHTSPANAHIEKTQEVSNIEPVVNFIATKQEPMYVAEKNDTVENPIPNDLPQPNADKKHISFKSPRIFAKFKATKIVGLVSMIVGVILVFSATNTSLVNGFKTIRAYFGNNTENSVAINSENSNQKSVLAQSTASGITSFNVNIESNFAEDVTFEKDVEINGGDVTTTSTSVNLFNEVATGVNIAGESTSTVISATTGTTTVRNTLAVGGNTITSPGDLTIDPGGGGVRIGTGTANSIDLSGDDFFVSGDLEVDGSSYIPTLVIGGDTFTDLTGTGLQVSSGTLQATLGTSISSSEIDDDTIKEIDLNASNSATNAYVLTYNSSTGGFSWAADQTGDESPWQTTSNVANLVTSTDNVTVGSSTNLGKLAVDGDTDEIQLLVQANSSQTANTFVIENSSGTDLYRINSSGQIVSGSSLVTLTTTTGSLDADAISLISSDGAGGTSSGSGLEVDTDRLGLLQGCADGEILKWVDSSSTWACSTDAGSGGTGIINVQNNDVAVGTNVDTIDFSTDFAVSASPSNEANISVADDILDFTEFTDSLTLDADTSIAAAAERELTYNKTFTDATTENGIVFNFTASDTSSGTTSQYGLVLQNQASTEGLDSLLYLNNADSDDSVGTGIRIESAAGTIATAIDINDTDIVTDIELQNGETIDNNTDGTITLTATSTTLSGDLAISGGNITTAVTADQTLTVTGTLTANGAFDSNGQVTIADTDIAFDGASTTFTTTGALTITPGGAVLIGDGGDTLQINSSDWAVSTTGDLTGIGAITMDGDLGITQADPAIFLTDSTAASDDYYISVDASLFVIANNSDTRNDLVIEGDGTINIGDNVATKSVDIGGVGSSATDTINIATNGTASDTIAIGNTNASTTIAITGGDDWNIATNGAANFTSIGATTAGTGAFTTLSATPGSTNDITLTIDADSTLVISGLQSGTGNALCVDGSNNVVTCTVGSGGISGSGTAGQIAFFSSGSAVTSESSGFGWDATNDRLTITSGNTTGTSVAISDSSLTTGKLFTATGTSTATTDTAITQNLFDITNAQSTNANSSFVGLGVNFTNSPSVAGNTEYAAQIQNQVTANTTDNAVAALLRLDNADTSASGSTVVTDALLITNSGTITGGLTNGITIGSGTQSITTGLNIASTGVTTDISLQNGETIDNNTDGTVLITSATTQTSGNLTVAGTTGVVFSGTGGDITFTNGEKIDNDTDGTLALTSTTLSFSGTTLTASSLSTITSAATLAFSGNATFSGGTVQLGANGADGSFILYNELGTTDYTVTINPSASQSGSYSLTLPVDDGSSNQVLTTDGSGALSWQTATGIGGVGDITAVGDVTSGAAFTATAGNDGTTLYFEGTTADANEVALTVADPDADYTVTIPAATGTVCLSTGNCAGGAGGSKWTDSGTVVYLTDTTDELVIGGSSALSSSKVSIDGDADQIQLTVQGNATQTSNLIVFENSAGTDLLSLSGNGAATLAAGSAETTALTITDTDYTNAISLGDNNITGTAYTIAASTSTLTLDAATSVQIDGDTSVIFQDAGTNYLTLSQSGTQDVSLDAAGGDLIIASSDVLTITGSADGTDYLKITAGDILLSDGDLDIAGGDFNVTLDAGDSVNIAKGTAPTADVFSINGGTSATDGVDTLQVTFTADDASGNLVDLSPTFTDNDAGNSAETWNVIDVDALTVTQNDSGGAVTGLVRGLNIGNLTETATGDDAITSSAIRVGTGWDDVLNYNGTTVVNGSGQVVSTQITGTLFSTDTDTASTNAITQGDTLSILGSSTDELDGIDVTHSGDTITLAFDGTEITNDTFGAGSGFTWTFDAGTTDPTIAFGDSSITLTGNLNANTGLDVDDVFVVADGGAVTANTDVDFSLASGENFTLTHSTPTVDAVSLALGTSSTDGADGMQLTFGVSAASGNVIDITPSYADATAGTTSETFNIIDIDAFTATQNATGDTGTITALNVGNLTQTETAGTISATAINIGTGWDTDIDLQNGLTLSNSDDNDLNLAENSLTLNVDFGEATASTITYSSASNLAFTVSSTSDIVLTGDADSDIQLNGIQSGTGNALCIDTGSNNKLVTCTVGSGGISGSGTAGQIAFFSSGSAITSESSGFGWDATNDLFTITSTADTETAVAFTGTAFTTGELLDLTGTFAPADGSTNEAIDINITHSPTSSADNFQSLNLTTTDGTALGNTVYGIQNTLTLTGNAAKTGIGSYSTVTSSSTTADTLISEDLATSVTGIMTTGTRAVYGLRSLTSAGAESTGGTTNVYGLYSSTSADVAAGGTVNSYGAYIANGTYDTDGTSNAYGLYVETISGADNNYTAAFVGGNVGIGTATPSTELTVVSGGTNSDVILVNASDGSRLSRLTETSGGAGWFEIDNSSGTAVSLFRADAGDSYHSSGEFGFGTTAPDKAVEINSATGANLRLTYNDSTGTAADYTDFSLDSNGNLTIAPTTDSGVTPGTVQITGDLTVTGGDITGANSAVIDLGEATTGALTFTAGTTGDFVFSLDADTNAQLTASAAPGVDMLALSNGGNASTTDGVDAFQLTFGVSAASGNVIDITPSYADATAGTTSETFNIIDIDAFTATQNAAGDTGLIRGLNIGNLTQTESAGTLTANAIKIGTGWDSILDYNGTTIIDGTGNVQAAQVSGTLFSTDTDTASANAIARGDTLSILGSSTDGLDGIDVTHSGDTITLAFDGTEITDDTFGAGAGFTWTFDAGATDPTLAFASDQVTLTAASTIFSGDITVQGGTVNGAAGESIDLGVATSDVLTFTTAAGTELTLSATNLNPGAAEGNSLGSATTEWEQIFVGDNNGLSLGLDQDWSLGYDEATDGRLELTTSGTSGMLISSATVSGTGLLTTFDSVTTGKGLDFSVDGLTTGDGLRLQSTTTSTSFSGNLGLVEWAPGSSTTATGNLFTINIGTNGTTSGDLFQIQDTGSDLFSVSETQITSALPHAFTASGDVTMAYDLQFTNQTASFIKSKAPLTLDTGESFESNDLTLQVYNAGSVVVGHGSASTTSTTGLLDINALAGNAAVIGADINLTQNDGATAGTDATALNINLTANDADGDNFGITLTANATTNAAAGSYETLFKLVNAENTAGAVTDAILIDSSSATDTDITDAIDVSDANIVNAINVGANYLLGDGVRQYSSSSTVWTIEDTAGNDLTTLTDTGTRGTLIVTGYIESGLADTSYGAISLHGDGAGSAEGGEIALSLAADHDGTFNSWYIDAYEDDIRIHDGSTERFRFSTTNFLPGAAELISIGSTTNEFEALYLGDNNGVFFGLDQDWSFGYDEATDDRLELTTSGTTGILVSSATVSGTGLLTTFDSVTTGTGASFSFDALTSGTGFLVESAPGSATTLSGDLFKINIGTNVTATGDIFVVQDTGSDLFAVNDSQITSTLPHQFTAAGDVTMAYDLQFTNQTSSYIKSNGPLYLEAGESFENNNLTLSTFGAGKIVLDPGTSGATVAAGPFSLDAQQTLTANSTTPSVAAGSHWITANTAGTAITNFTSGTNGQILAIEINDANTDFDCTSTNLKCGAGDITTTTTGDLIYFIYDGTNWNLINWVEQADTQSGGADLAEVYVSQDTLVAGEVVSIHPTNAVEVTLGVRNDSQRVIGVVSTQPHLVMGENEVLGRQAYPIALAGRVPVKISQTSSSIQIGDLIGASATPGRAEKVTSGYIIGRALESWTPGSSDEDIVIYVNPIYVANEALASSGIPADLELQTLKVLSDAEINNLDVTNLTVLGTTTLSDTVINGNLQIGTLVFDDQESSIDAIGILKIQPLALGKIEFMNGLVTIETNGTLTTKEIKTEKLTVLGEAAGVGTILAGENEVYINSTQVLSNSLIFVTPKKAISTPLSVTLKEDGLGFKVEISASDTQDIEFDWFIVNKE